MAWNEPGGNKQRNPWRDNSSSLTLDALLKRLKDALGLVSGGGGGDNSSNASWIMAVFGILLAWFAFDSWCVIDARQVGVVQRFGQFSRVMDGGLNFKWPRPIEHVTKVEKTQVRSVSDQVRMLTQDENIVLIDFNVQYQVADAQLFLFRVRDPDATLKQAAESALRQTIGAHDMDTILSGQGAELVSDTRKVLQQALDSYQTGLIVTDVNFQSVAPPHEVKEAFDDVNSAREDKQRIENEAQAYANKVIPEARGDAARIRAEAEGYKAERVAHSEGDVQRFNLLETQYKMAPEVTRKRLYIETMQQVVGGSAKVVDLSGGKNMLYLPLTTDKGTSVVPSPSMVGPAVTATPELPKGKH